MRSENKDPYVHEEQTPPWEKHMSAEEIKNWKDFMISRVRQTISVGDPSLRKNTRNDLRNLNEARQAIDQNDPGTIDRALKVSKDVFTGGGDHSMLAKIIAVINYVDAGLSQEEPPEGFFETLTESTLTEPGTGNMEILTGTAYARVMDHFTRKENGQEVAETVEQITQEQVTDKNSARTRLAIQTVANEVRQMITNDELNMQLPKARIITGEKTEGVRRTGAGYPDSVMYLGEGRLPSQEKMEEAVIYGVPDTSNTILTRRGLRLLMGVEISPRHAREGSKGNLTTNTNKEMVHISLPPLIKPQVPAEIAFATREDLNDDNIFDKATFDALSHHMAVRTSREVEGKFEAIDIDAHPQKDRRKLKLTNRKIATRMQEWSQPLAVNKGEELSVMGVALKESQEIHGENDWDMEHALRHLGLNSRALLLRDDEGRLTARNEEEINDLYMEGLWRNLDAEDRKELALAQLTDPDSSLWELIPRDQQNSVAWAVCEGTSLGEEETNTVLQVFENERHKYLVTRSETIRDKKEPEGLIKRVFAEK